MPTHLCTNRNKCVKYGNSGGKYKDGSSAFFSATVYDAPCRYCIQAEEEERQRIASDKEERAAQLEHERKEQAAQAEHVRKEQAAQAQHARKEQAGKAEHVRKEQAAQANHDRQVQLQDMKNKELDRLIILEEKKTIAKKEEHEYQLKIMEHERETKALENEAEETKRKYELSRMQSQCELEKAQAERVSKEIELLRMKIAIAQEDATAATDKPTGDDYAAERKESTAPLVKRKSCKAKAKKAIREICSLKA